MAAPARLITLNIGSQTIGLAEFRVIQGRLVLLNYRFREAPLDPATGQRRDAHVAVEETGLRTRILGVASMGLYNAFCYNYTDLKGCSLLVDIGARTTNVLFIEAGRIFSRSLPIGSSAITAAIAKEFGESLAAAETRKNRDAFVALGGAAEPADPNIGRLSKIVRSTMTRLHAELIRSVTYYRAQQQRDRPARIFLCGGGAGMPNMREL